jgi:tetratricopeptide (TPR) repeat protein
LFPLLIILGIEIVLRLSGFGYPTQFLVRSKLTSPDQWIENDRFTYRFFPKAMARTPQPLLIEPAEEELRILVVGESAAMGDPAPPFGVARMLEVQLSAAFPNRKIEVINSGITAINSHVIVPLLEDALKKIKPNFVVIYMGNNEVVGPFGAGTIFGSQAPPVSVVKANLALKNLKIGQFIDQLRQPKGAQQQEWRGMEMFLNQQVPYNDPRLRRVYENFSRNLQEIVHLVIKHRAEPIVSTLVSNLRDCAPFASVSTKGASAAEQLNLQLREIWGKLETSPGVAQEQALSKLLQQEPNFANTHYLLGQLQLKRGKLQEAEASLVRARDLDALRFRADTELNNLIRTVCSNLVQTGQARLLFLDAEQAFRRFSTNGIPGAELLYEHVHFTFSGNYVLSQLFAEIIGVRFSNLDTLRARWPTQEKMGQILGWTPYQQSAVYDHIRKRMLVAPFTNQLNHLSRDADLKQQLDSLQPLLAGTNLLQQIDLHRRVAEARPNDWVVQEQLAELLDLSGNYPAAIHAWTKISTLLPHYAQPHYKMGTLLDLSGQPAEAQRAFEAALARKPESVEALNGLGLALANQGNLPQAIEKFRKALSIKPNFAEAHVNWGLVLANQKDFPGAITHYQEALRLKPQSAPAHQNLAKVYSAEGKLSQALTHYQEAVKINPRDGIAHFNLANTYHRLERNNEAFQHFAQAAEFAPHLAEAHFNLGVHLARQGNLTGAEASFRKAVQANSQDPENLFSWGISLAQLGRFSEAAAAFRKTLELQPAHPQAAKYLQMAESRLQQR